MHTTLPSELLVLLGTSLVSSEGSKDLAIRLESGTHSAAASLMIASSSEAMVSAVSSQHSTSHS
jgi:hypothetical protein